MKRIVICLLMAGLCLPLLSQEKSLDNYLTEYQSLLGEENFREAVDVMKNAVSANQEVAAAHFHLAQAWSALSQQASQSGDYQTAMEAVNGTFEGYKNAVKLDPDNYEYRFNYGMYGINVPSFFGKLDVGVEQLEEALAIAQTSSPQNVPVVYRFLGQGYFAQGRIEKAKAAWDAVLTMVPEGELAEGAKAGLAELEKVDVTTGDEVEAEEEITEDLETLITAGRALYADGNWPEATKTLKKATKLDPENADLQFLLARSVMMDAAKNYDERVYEDTDTRTHLAFEVAEQLERAYELDPDNPEIKLHFAVICIQMPFFVGKIDKGLALLEEMAKDDLPEDIKSEVLYQLGYGYRKKGHAVWMRLVKDMPGEPMSQSVYDEYGLREFKDESVEMRGEKVEITFHLGFMDELAPQTALWIEDNEGKFVKTLYVSGFSAFAKEKQINLPDWSRTSEYETDGTTGASIDWGKHTYVWDLTDHEGRRVKNGTYKVQIEVSWWPTMKYGRTSAKIKIGRSPDEVTVAKEPWVPMMRVNYLK